MNFKQFWIGLDLLTAIIRPFAEVSFVFLVGSGFWKAISHTQFRHRNFKSWFFYTFFWFAIVPYDIGLALGKLHIRNGYIYDPSEYGCYGEILKGVDYDSIRNTED